MTPLPRLLFVALGGTIASVRPVAGEAGGVAPGLPATELVAAIPELAEVATIVSTDREPVVSYELGPEQMLEVAREVAQARDDGYDGAIVTQGTDTLEEMAYLLALTLPRGQPVAVSGALRNPTLPGADGPANLLSAATVAADSRTGALGPVVVLGDEVHLARWATKTHTSRTWALQSPGTGPVGEVVEGRVHLWHGPLYADYLGLPESLAHLRVPLLRVAVGDDGALLSAISDPPPDGLVIEGTGGGHVPAALLDTLEALRGQGVPVVIATRAGAGRNLEQTYATAGGEIDLLRRGVLPAGWLGGGKARLRLMVALALGLEPGVVFPMR